MKRLWGLLSIFLFCGVLGHGTASAAEPSKVKIGILLPLTGTFAAVAETQKQGALLATTTAGACAISAAIRVDCRSGGAPDGRKKSVSTTGPGDTVFMVTPRGPSSRD